jgi:hypothetical protein
VKAIFIRPSAYSRRGCKRSLRSCFSTTSRKPDRSIPNRAYLYATNRLHHSIAVFAVGTQGHLEGVGEAWTQGDYPSRFNLDPSGTFLYACNQRSDQITSFRMYKETELLTFTSRYTPVDTPICITFSSRDVSFRAGSQVISVASNSPAKAYDRCSAYWTHCLSSGRFLSTFCIDVV